MKKLKGLLTKQIESYLSRVDFDFSKISLESDHGTVDLLGLNDRLSEYLKEILDKIVEEATSGANMQMEKIVDEIIEQIDPDSLAEVLSNEIGKKVMTFQPVVHIQDPICPTCYRMYGEWTCDSGGTLSEQEINKNGTKIICVDDF